MLLSMITRCVIITAALSAAKAGCAGPRSKLINRSTSAYFSHTDGNGSCGASMLSFEALECKVTQNGISEKKVEAEIVS